ncbi:hypothetical protein [Aquimarina pacifica]|uniref:hypothetical protein n=1 Tax=Aquimarina pacifica TaxID=1296415 RepID=UPI00047138F7|nr:hypothetical protein [Aquimarina pacifica]
MKNTVTFFPKQLSVCLLLCIPAFIFCQTEQVKLDFSECQVTLNNEILIRISPTGDIYDKEGQVVAKIDKEEGMVHKSNRRGFFKIENNEVTDTYGYHVATVDSLGQGSTDLLSFRWSEKGELITNGKKTPITISPIDTKSYQVVSIFLHL